MPALELKKKFNLHTLYLIPNYLPPFCQKRFTASPGQRLAMIRLAIRPYPSLRTSSIELEHRRRSYTVTTLTRLRKRFSHHTFYFICGLDTLLTLPAWKRYQEVLANTHFIVVRRPKAKTSRKALMSTLRRLNAVKTASGVYTIAPFGSKLFFFSPSKHLPYSSSEIRARIARGLSCNDMLPKSVYRYILKHTLYQKETG